VLRATVMVRRLKADVLPQLPAKRRQQVRCYTQTSLASKLHVRRLQKDRATSRTYSVSSPKRTRSRQIQHHPCDCRGPLPWLSSAAGLTAETCDPRLNDLLVACGSSCWQGRANA